MLMWDRLSSNLYPRSSVQLDPNPSISPQECETFFFKYFFFYKTGTLFLQFTQFVADAQYFGLYIRNNAIILFAYLFVNLLCLKQRLSILWTLVENNLNEINGFLDKYLCVYFILSSSYIKGFFFLFCLFVFLFRCFMDTSSLLNISLLYYWFLVKNKKLRRGKERNRTMEGFRFHIIK